MIGLLIEPELHELIAGQKWADLRDAVADLDPSDVAEILEEVPSEQIPALFRLLPRRTAADVFSHWSVERQEELLTSFTGDMMRSVVQGMTPDDQARLLDELPAEITRRLMEVLPSDELKAARNLLGYPEDSAGRFMTPRYVAVRPDVTAKQAIDHLRTTAATAEVLSIIYVVNEQGKLEEEIRLYELVMAPEEKLVRDIQDRPLVCVPATMNKEEVVKQFAKYDRVALPVVDSDGAMLGVITADDVLDVAEQEATEDMQKIGGMEALDLPYFETGLFSLVKKRGGWLSALFLGEMLTATAMSYFEGQIAKAVVLALFVPLIISSGGNSGSQAATLIIRALAVDEMHLRDWWRVCRRELVSGLSLGSWLGMLGFVRVALWQNLHLVNYGEHYMLVAATVWLSLIGVVMFGTLTGSMLPFLLSKLGFDPATSSAPFVATLVDVTGLVIYFLVAMAVMSGTLL